jgi:hypothetical protein
MRPLPVEILLKILRHFDDANISRAMKVCRAWALAGRDVMCSRGPPCGWLCVASNKQYAHWIRHLVLRSPGASSINWGFPNVRRLSVALSLLDERWLGSTLVTLSRCGAQKALSLTIFDDGSWPGVNLSAAHPFLQRCLTSHAFIALACQEKIQSLTVDAVLMPAQLQWGGYPITPQPRMAFKGLATLKARITVDTAWSTLAVVPTLAELTLDIIAPDNDGRLVSAVASLQPALRVLKLNFWCRFSLGANRDLAALSTLSRLRVIEIGSVSCAQACVDLSPDMANPQSWRAFFRNLPDLRTLKLPTPWQAPPMTGGLRLSGGQPHHHLQYMHFNGALDVGDLRDASDEILLPCLQTLILKKLLPKNKPG